MSDEDKKSTQWQERFSFMRSKEETTKTKLMRTIMWILILVVSIAAIIFVFSKDLFGVEGLGLEINKKYVVHMNKGVMLLIALCSFPFWHWVFDKIKLFVRGYILDFSEIPVISKIEETAQKMKGSFFYGGHPLKIIYKKKGKKEIDLEKHHMEFALCLGEYRTADEIEKIYQENVIYKNLYKQYSVIYNELADNLIDDMSIQNIKERLMKGEDVEDVVRELIEQKTEDNSQVKKGKSE